MTITADLETVREALEGVLCDPEGTVVIAGSDGDRAVLQQAITLLPSILERVKALEEKEADLVDKAEYAAHCYQRLQDEFEDRLKTLTQNLRIELAQWKQRHELLLKEVTNVIALTPPTPVIITKPNNQPDGE